MIVSTEWPSLVPPHRIDDLCRDSYPSLRTLWSAVVKSPKFSVHEVRLCQYVFCTGPLWFWSSGRSRNLGPSGRWVKMVCFYPVPLLLAAPEVIREKNWKCLDVLEHFHQPVHAWTPLANLAHLATHHSVILRRHFYLGRSSRVSHNFLRWRFRRSRWSRGTRW